MSSQVTPVTAMLAHCSPDKVVEPLLAGGQQTEDRGQHERQDAARRSLDSRCARH
jgi:hypothetical protein